MAPAAPNTARVGQWSPIIPLPNVPIHTHVLPTGKVLFWGRRHPPGQTNLIAQPACDPRIHLGPHESSGSRPAHQRPACPNVAFRDCPILVKQAVYDQLTREGCHINLSVCNDRGQNLAKSPRRSSPLGFLSLFQGSASSSRAQRRAACL